MLAGVRRRAVAAMAAVAVLVSGCAGTGGSAGSNSSAGPGSTSASASIGPTINPSASSTAGDGPCTVPAGAVAGTEQLNVVMTAMTEQLGPPTLSDTQMSSTGIRQYAYCYVDANQVQVDQVVSYLIGAGYGVDPAAAAPTSTMAVFSSGASGRAPRFVSILISGAMTVPTTAVTPSGAGLEGSGGLEIAWQD